ncbi:MAG: hypothetical protein ACT4TC_23435, partial [Myxococcaceae bacterium]
KTPRYVRAAHQRRACDRHGGLCGSAGAQLRNEAGDLTELFLQLPEESELKPLAVHLAETGAVLTPDARGRYALGPLRSNGEVAVWIDSRVMGLRDGGATLQAVAVDGRASPLSEPASVEVPVVPPHVSSGCGCDGSASLFSASAVLLGAVALLRRRNR